MSHLITNEKARQIETNIVHALNQKAKNILSPVSLRSPRAVGDAVQEFLTQHLSSCIPAGIVHTYETGFQRRSMEDMAFDDKNGYYYAIDAKTHNINTNFNMPNLISVRRLANFYMNDKNFFNILIVEYEVKNSQIHYTKCHFRPIEQFSWDCLTFGALGWGQIQIANSNHLIFDTQKTRKQWMIKMCELIDVFYYVELGKITERKNWFCTIKDFWVKHK